MSAPSLNKASVILVLLLAAGTLAGVWQWRRHHPPRPDFESQEAWLSELKRRHPELALKDDQVPDEENGYLQWLMFAEALSGTKGWDGAVIEMSDDLDAFRQKDAAVDAASLGTLLEPHAEHIKNLLRIGLLPRQSSHGIDHAKANLNFGNPRFYKSCADLLLMEARRAAAAGEEERAISCVRAVFGLCRHLARHEHTTLLDATVVILVRMNAGDILVREVVPGLSTAAARSSAADLATELDVTVEELALCLCGETRWGTTMLVAALWADPSAAAPDPEQFVDRFAAAGFERAEFVRGLTGAELPTARAIAPTTLPAGTAWTNRAEKTWRLGLEGLDSWVFGFTRSMIVLTQHRAALLHLLGETPPLEPVSGLPFVLDPDTRLLRLPDHPALAEFDIEPLLLPDPPPPGSSN